MRSGTEKSPSKLAGAGNWAKLRGGLSDSYPIDRDYQGDLDIKSVGFGISHLKEEKNGKYISNIYESNYIQGGKRIRAKYIPVEQFDNNKKNYYKF